jgi:hypothetical protein
MSAQINTIGSHRILVKNSKRGGMGGEGRCLGGIGHLAALVQLLHFSPVHPTMSRRSFASAARLLLALH